VAVDTLAKPNITSTTLGKQHMDARKADPPTTFHSDLTSLDATGSVMRPNPSWGF
jgi:hypothetical protein